MFRNPLVLSGLAALVACQPSDEDQQGTDAESFVGNFPSASITMWPYYTVDAIEVDGNNTDAVIAFDGEVISETHYVWDFWPLRTPNGEVALVDGRTVMFALAAPRAGNVPGERHAIATWRMFTSTGNGWIDGGDVFVGEEPVGNRQWAGSAVLDTQTQRVDLYYTALGDLEPLPDDPESPTNAADGYEDARNGGPSIVRQQIAATSARLVNGPGGAFQLDGFTQHEVLLDPDGELYTTADQAKDKGTLHVFRDPWYFEDPESERRYLLFSASPGFRTGAKEGCVGLAVWDEETFEWRSLPPLVGAFGTNSQLERPHIVYREGRYHMFFSSHEFTFAGEDRPPEGLYGFFAEKLRGHYRPLNDGGLVLANPPEAPLQAYSYTVLPGGVVTSFVNYIDLGGVTLEGIGDQTRQWQIDHFGGTPAEPDYLVIEDGSTRRLQFSPALGVPRGTETYARALGGG